MPEPLSAARFNWSWRGRRRAGRGSANWIPCKQKGIHYKLMMGGGGVGGVQIGFFFSLQKRNNIQDIQLKHSK